MRSAIEMDKYKTIQCSEGKTKKIPNTKQRFLVHTNGGQICLSELLVVSETFTTSLAIKVSVSVGSAIFIFCQQQMED